MTELMNNKSKNANTKRDWKKQPATVIVHLGAGTTTIIHEAVHYDATNGDKETLETIARNICDLCGITR